jgi:hypothetical protein
MDNNIINNGITMGFWGVCGSRAMVGFGAAGILIRTVKVRVVVQHIASEHRFVEIAMESWVDAVVLKLLDVTVGSI